MLYAIEYKIWFLSNSNNYDEIFDFSRWDKGFILIRIFIIILYHFKIKRSHGFEINFS